MSCLPGAWPSQKSYTQLGGSPGQSVAALGSENESLLSGLPRGHTVFSVEIEAMHVLLLAAEISDVRVKPPIHRKMIDRLVAQMACKGRTR